VRPLKISETGKVTMTKTYTAYIVRDSNKRRFLNRPVYSGHIHGVWGLMKNSHVFTTKAQAQSCASNINFRRPIDSAFNATVREIELTRKR
jgi:hypothetical protein